jgi:hypothetical protein
MINVVDAVEDGAGSDAETATSFGVSSTVLMRWRSTAGSFAG